jgi:hypothetical protein
MKKLLIGLLLAAGGTIASDDDALRMLMITPNEANMHIIESVWKGRLDYPFVMVHKLEVEYRAGILRGMFRYGRQALRDTAFLNAYQRFRDEKKPQPPATPRSGADFHNEQVTSLREQVRDAEAQMKAASPQERDVYISLLSALRDALRQAESRPKDDIARMDEVLSQQYELDMRQYRDTLARFDMAYPADPKVLVRRRLQEYLDLLLTVDFDAVTRRINGNVRIFENPRYEDKPPMWKLCYRAGRELNMIAQSEAREWLAELEK